MKISGLSSYLSILSFAKYLGIPEDDLGSYRRASTNSASGQEDSESYKTQKSLVGLEGKVNNATGQRQDDVDCAGADSKRNSLDTNTDSADFNSEQ